MSAALEAGAAAEVVAAWAAARGGEAALGEAATGGWAEAGSSGVAAWLVHTGACSIGVLMRRDRERQQVKGILLHGVEGWVQQRQAGQTAPSVLQTEQDLPEGISPGSGKEPPHHHPRTGPQERRAQTTRRISYIKIILKPGDIAPTHFCVLPNFSV